MTNSNESSGTRWHALARYDCTFVVGALVTVALVAAAPAIVPLWSDVILASCAGVLLALLGLERLRARQQSRWLVDQIKSLASLEKLEVPADPSTAALGEALNDVIQRSREQARIVEMAPRPVPAGEALRLLGEADETPRSVAILALGLCEQDQSTMSPETMEQLRDIAGTVVAVADQRSALLQMQGSGTFALIFAAFSQEPAARSATAAYEAAVELAAAHPALRFGLSSGTGAPVTLPGAGYTVIGSPLEEAIRLHRLAVSWSEFRLLCPEPVALLLRPRAAGHRTPLQLTSPNAMALPVYSLEIVPEVIALKA